MASDYVVRVELRGSPTAAQYADLHKRMENLGLYMFITADDGQSYAMPHATYSGRGLTDDMPRIRDAAHGAARAVVANPDPQVIVIRSSGSAWSLTPLKS